MYRCNCYATTRPPLWSVERMKPIILQILPIDAFLHIESLPSGAGGQAAYKRCRLAV